MTFAIWVDLVTTQEWTVIVKRYTLRMALRWILSSIASVGVNGSLLLLVFNVTGVAGIRHIGEDDAEEDE